MVVPHAHASDLVGAGGWCREQKTARSNESRDPRFLARQLYEGTGWSGDEPPCSVDVFPIPLLGPGRGRGCRAPRVGSGMGTGGFFIPKIGPHKSWATLVREFDTMPSFSRTKRLTIVFAVPELL